MDINEIRKPKCKSKMHTSNKADENIDKIENIFDPVLKLHLYLIYLKEYL